ncbi:MAG TPA: hypothetical protein VKE40_19835 [Gemmataceae bacterium]|nr:hypothetical protein [Gemmataceae bacterium]
MSATLRLLFTTLALVLFMPPAPADDKADKAGKTGVVEGKITYNGNPLKGGTVSFHIADGTMVTANIKSDGTFRATDVPVGKAKVTIETESAKPKGKDKDANNYVKIPQTYAGANTSPLEVMVVAGKQTIDFVLRN